MSSSDDGAAPAAPHPRLPAAVLWDMDGTLVDTEPYWFAAQHDLVDELGNGNWTDEHNHALIGKDLIDAATYIREHGGVDLPPHEVVERLLDGVIARLHRQIPWRPGARELLGDLRDAGVPCALVTMSWRRFVDPILAALPTDSFVATITGDAVPEGEGKPHPTPYLMGAEACGADPRDCVAIEDSRTGIRSALRAGCHVLAVPCVQELAPAPGVTLADSLDGIRPSDLGALLDSQHGAPTADRRPTNGRPLLLVLAAAAVVAIAVAWWVGRGGEDAAPPLPPGAVAIDVWVPYWVLGDVAIDGYDRLAGVREISPFWFGARGVEDIVVDEQSQPDETAAFLAAVDASSIVPSIRDEMPAGGMAAIIADPALRTRHVEALVTFARQQDATGLDLDYEQFAFADDHATWETTRPNWVAFVAELAAALHDDGRTLTVSIPGIWDRNENGSEGYWVYDHGAIAEHVDSMRIMAYDYSTSEPGPIAPLPWVADVVRSVSEVVPEEFHGKLVLGVPTYGSNWVVSTLGTCPASAEGRTGVTARGALDLATRRGATPVYEPTVGEWSFTYALNVEDATSTCVQNRAVHWVDSEGVDARVVIAREAGWGGVALWALGYDDAEVWSAFTDSAVRTLVPTTAP